MHHTPIVLRAKIHFQRHQEIKRCYPCCFTWNSWDDPAKLACYLQGWGLTELPLRASSQFLISFSRVAWSILDGGRRTSTFLSCGWRRPGSPTARSGSLHRAGCEDGRAGRRQDPLFDHGCATRQLWPVPRSTFKGTDNPSFFPVASISVFTRCFASSNSFSGTSKINSSWT